MIILNPQQNSMNVHPVYTIGDVRVELVLESGQFLGLGRVWIGDTLVRSGRLPLGVTTHTFAGDQLTQLEWVGVEQREDQLSIRLKPWFEPMAVKPMRDHSFDPIHDTADWIGERSTSSRGFISLTVTPARDHFNGVGFAGLAYHWQVDLPDFPLYHLYERGSWELDGDAEGVSVVSQSSCSDPCVTFAADTAWSTEGRNGFHANHTEANPVMTHNLPRWASHQAFDFQYRGAKTLIGVYERVELIRTVLRREADHPEIKVFDKHIFDQAQRHSTPTKRILMNTDAKDEIDQRNIWTWVFDEVHERARAEFGLERVPTTIGTSSPSTITSGTWCPQRKTWVSGGSSSTT